MHELPKNSSLSTPAMRLPSITLACINRLSYKKSALYALLAWIPPTLAAAMYTCDGLTSAKNRWTLADHASPIQRMCAGSTAMSTLLQCRTMPIRPCRDGRPHRWVRQTRTWSEGTTRRRQVCMGRRQPIQPELFNACSGIDFGVA